MSSRHRMVAILSLALLLAGGWAWAQGPGNGPQGPGIGPGGGGGFFAEGGPQMGRARHRAHHLGRLIRALDLSEEQQEQARAIREQARDQSQAVREEQRALRDELRTALDGESPSAEAVGAIVISLHQNRRQLRAIREQAWTDFQALLTPEQLERFEQFRENRRDRGPRGRRGGR
ncbi:MAG TPA: Spy/CpxP family protein refolding chaperone [Acidobacteriota bacterium]|nr:Spy/CpxP family protein refolding chaperone [Acidobacteriota bacterium]